MGQDPLERPAEEPLSLSVIICTFERAALLRVCLQSLLECHPPICPWQLIVVDNDSRDKTHGTVEEFQKALPNLSLLTIPERNLSVARNKGCEEATGLYLIYLDDDAKVPKDYLLNVEASLKQNQPDLMGGPVYPYYSSPKPDWFRDSYETKKFTEVSKFCTQTRVTGANFTIKKSILQTLGMFDPKRGMQGKRYVVGDERKVLDTYRHITPPDLQKVYYSLECSVYHHVDPRKLRFSYFLYRYFLGGYTTQLIRLELSARAPRLIPILKEGVFWLCGTVTHFAKARNPAVEDTAMDLALRILKLGELAACLSFVLRSRLRRP